MRELKLRPKTIVYETANREKYDYLKSDYALYYSNPNMFSIAELKYDYFVSERQHIKDEYRKYGVPDLLVELEKKGETESQPEAPKIVPEKFNEIGHEGTAPVGEPALDPDNASQAATDEQNDDVGAMSWPELRTAAKEAGLEGKFGKAEAIEYLKSQQ